MRRKASKLLLLSTGAALAWFLDPVSGAARRRQLADQLAGLTERAGPPSDPTGGAVPTTAGATPPPASPAASGPEDLSLVQAVEAATGGEKVLRGSSEPQPQPEDEGDRNRATLRTTW